MSIRLPAKALCLALLIGLWAPQLRADDTDFEQSMAQARVFVKKGWYRDAIKELRRAVSTPQGEKNFDAHMLLAQACYREMDIGCAVTMADTARGLARSQEERNSSGNVLEYLQKNYGKVEFRAAPGEPTEGYLELEPQEPILDREVKLYYKEKVAPLAEQRRSLPWIMYLPAVTYKLYGQEFTVEGGQEMVVNAGFTVENSKPKPEKPKPPPDFEGIGVALQLRIGGGLALNAGPESGFGPVADLSAHKTLGEMFRVGAFAKFNYDLGASGNYPALSYGAIGTVRLILNNHLAFLPAVGYAYGKGPAVRFSDCTETFVGSEDVIVCGDPAHAGAIPATLSSQVHGPLGRLELAYEKRTEKSILTGQVGVQAHYGLFGAVSSGEGTLTVDGKSTSIGYQVPEGYSVHPLRVELLAGVNMTF